MAQNETAKAQVFLDGKQAESVIKLLKKEAKALRVELDKASKAGDFTKVAQLNREIKRLSTATSSAKRETYDYQKVLKNINGASFNEVRNSLRAVNSQLKKMRTTDPGYKQKAAEARTLDARLKAMNASYRAQIPLMKRISSAMNHYGTMIMTVVGSMTGLIMLGRKAVTMFNDFEAGLTDVYTLLNDDKFDQFAGSLEQVSKNAIAAGYEVKDSNKALFDYISATGDAAGAGEAFTEIMKLSKAGSTELGVAVDGVTSIMNAYNLKAEDSERVTSAFFTAQKYGKTTVTDLAANVGKLAPTLKAAGVGFEELLSGLAELTKQGIKTDIAATSLRALMSALIKPGKEARQVLSDLEIPFGTTQIRAMGLAETLRAVNKAMVEHPDDIAKAIPNIRALTGMYALTGDALNDYDIILKDVITDVGEASSLSKGYTKVLATQSDQLKVAQGRLKAVTIEMGEHLAPSFIHLTDAGTLSVKMLLSLVKWLTLYSRQIGTAALAVGTYTVATKLLNKEWRAAIIAKAKLNGMIKPNLWALAAAGVVLLVRAIVKHNQEAIKAEKHHKAFNEALIAEQGHADDLFETYKKLNPESEAANTIREKLVKLYPELLKDYVDEKGHITNIAEAQKLVGDQIERTIALRMREEEMNALGEKAYKKQAKNVDNILGMAGTTSQKGAAASIISDSRLGLQNGELSVDEVASQLANIMEIDKTKGSGYRSTKYDQLSMYVYRIKAFQDQLEDAKEDVKVFYRSFLGDGGSKFPAVAKDIVINDNVPELDDSFDLEDMDAPDAVKDKDITAAMDRQWAERKMQLEKQYAETGVLDKASKAKLLAEEIAYLKVKEALLAKNGRDTLAVRQDIHSKEMDLEAQLWTMEEEEMMAEWDIMLAQDQAEIDALLAKNATKESETDRHLAAMKDKAIAAAEEQKKREKAALEAQQHQAEIIVGVGQDMGDLISDTIADSEDSMDDFGKNMVLIALKVMKSMIPIWAAQIVGGSLATPQSIMTAGGAGLVQASMLTALMYAAVGGVEGAVKASMNEGYYDGGYTGSGDNRGVAGPVHNNEWVANHKATGNSDVRKILDVFDKAQRDGTIGQLRVPEILTQVSRGYPTTPAQNSSSTAHSANSTSTPATAAEPFVLRFPVYKDSGAVEFDNVFDVLDYILSNAKNFK